MVNDVTDFFGRWELQNIENEYQTTEEKVVDRLTPLPNFFLGGKVYLKFNEKLIRVH